MNKNVLFAIKLLSIKQAKRNNLNNKKASNEDEQPPVFENKAFNRFIDNLSDNLQTEIDSGVKFLPSQIVFSSGYVIVQEIYNLYQANGVSNKQKIRIFLNNILRNIFDHFYDNTVLNLQEALVRGLFTTTTGIKLDELILPYFYYTCTSELITNIGLVNDIKLKMNEVKKYIIILILNYFFCTNYSKVFPKLKPFYAILFGSIIDSLCNKKFIS